MSNAGEPGSLASVPVPISAGGLSIGEQDPSWGKITQKLSPAGLCQDPRVAREIRWGGCWSGHSQVLSHHHDQQPSRPSPIPRGARWCLTQVVGAAQVEGVAAVHVVIQGLLNQVLRFVPGQLRHSAESKPRGMRGGRGGVPAPQTALTSQSQVSHLICKMGS